MNIKRKIGAAIYYLLARHLPVSYSPLRFGQTRLRRFCGRLMLASCGRDVNIEKGAIFSEKVALGDHSGIGINARIHGECHIGRDVMMGEGCVVITRNHGHSRTDIPMRLQGFEPERPVWIEDDVWIGDRVTILPGVRVGRGSILAAGAVVVKNVPEYAVVGGVPARVIQYRDKTAKALGEGEAKHAGDGETPGSAL